VGTGGHAQGVMGWSRDNIEELILYSFNAYIITLFLFYIYNKYNIKADGEAE